MALFQYRDGKEGGWWVEDKRECAWVTDKAILRRGGGRQACPRVMGKAILNGYWDRDVCEWATMVVAAISIT